MDEGKFDQKLRFTQIAATNDRVYGLDVDGEVWWCFFDGTPEDGQHSVWFFVGNDIG